MLILNRRLSLALGFSLFFCCATTQQFRPLPDQTKAIEDSTKSRIYVLRPSFVGGAISMNVWDGNTQIGKTGPQGYLCWERNPDSTILFGKAENTSQLPINLQEGNVYYVEQQIRMGILFARNKLKLLSPQEGKDLLRSCTRPIAPSISQSPVQTTTNSAVTDGATTALPVPKNLQETNPIEPAANEIPGFHQHDGFFLSMNVGPVIGDVIITMTGAPFNKMTYSGTGATVDFKIGAAFIKNNIISLDIISRSMTVSEMMFDGRSLTSFPDPVSAGDVTTGIGFTHYFMPYNLFINGTIGISTFSIESGGTKAESESGYSLHIKTGKEWWVSKNWGLGISGGYGLVIADDKADPSMPSYTGTLSTNKLFFMFNTTFN